MWKINFWTCDFCEKWVFENVIFVKNEILKMRFLLECDFKNVNLKMWISWNMSIFGLNVIFCPSVGHLHGNTECFTSYDSETLRLSRLVEDFVPDRHRP